eukprot:1643006-Amphidinium_carterae.1
MAAVVAPWSWWLCQVLASMLRLTYKNAAAANLQLGRGGLANGTMACLYCVAHQSTTFLVRVPRRELVVLPCLGNLAT